MSARASDRGRQTGDSTIRWECACQETPVLLGTYDASGVIHIKMRDRYWHIAGSVRTTCPRCGTEHTLTPLAGN
ncbi:MAG: hypothetical protein IT336_13350 [Thermomicrobiales bacterium]|nr:hypothetical protein [Thermomicrobiales bacterium]